MLSELTLKEIPNKASNHVKEIYVTQTMCECDPKETDHLAILQSINCYKKIGVLIGKKIYWLRLGFVSASEVNDILTELGVAIRDDDTWTTLNNSSTIGCAELGKQMINIGVAHPDHLPSNSPHLKKSLSYKDEGYNISGTFFFDVRTVKVRAYLANPNKVKGSLVSCIIKRAVKEGLEGNASLAVASNNDYYDDEDKLRPAISFTVNTEVGEIEVNIDGEIDRVDTNRLSDGGYTEDHVVKPKGLLSLVVPISGTGERREILPHQISGIDGINKYIRETFVGFAYRQENDKWRSLVGDYVICGIKSKR